MAETSFNEKKGLRSGKTSVSTVLPSAMVETVYKDEYVTKHRKIKVKPAPISRMGAAEMIIKTKSSAVANYAEEEVLHKCPCCDRQFRSIGPLKSHYSKAHRDSAPPFYIIDLSLHCRVCSKSFVKRKAYDSHIKTHVKKGTAENEGKATHILYPCDLCDRSYQWMSALNNHYVVHKNQGICVCLVCKEHFPEYDELMIHYSLHTEEEKMECKKCYQRKFCVCHQFKCGMCREVMETKEDLQLHYTIHTKLKPFKCDVCSTCFRFKTQLERHAEVHKDEEFFKCGECGKMFTRLNSLRDHRKLHIKK